LKKKYFFFGGDEKNKKIVEKLKEKFSKDGKNFSDYINNKLEKIKDGDIFGYLNFTQLNKSIFKIQTYSEIYKKFILDLSREKLFLLELTKDLVKNFNFDKFEDVLNDYYENDTDKFIDSIYKINVDQDNYINEFFKNDDEAMKDDEQTNILPSTNDTKTNILPSTNDTKTNILPSTNDTKPNILPSTNDTNKTWIEAIRSAPPGYTYYHGQIVPDDNGYPACFGPDGFVKLESGIVKKISEILIGDSVQTLNGFNKVVKIYKYDKKEQNVFDVNGVLLTKRHPVYINNIWCYPEEISELKKENIELFNLELCKGDTFIQNDHTVIIDNVVCATMGCGPEIKNAKPSSYKDGLGYWNSSKCKQFNNN
jgi:hypothetical protein